MKKNRTRLLSLLLTLALLLLPAASMAESQLDLSDASPETLAALANALHVIPVDAEFIKKELENQLETGEANGILRKGATAYVANQISSGKTYQKGSGRTIIEPGTIGRKQNGEITVVNPGVVPTLGNNPFAAVFNDSWKEEFIAYCGNARVSGGNGKFAPDGAVTGTEAAEMLTVALGANMDLANFAEFLHDANLRYAIENGRMEGAGVLSYTSPVLMPEECPDGGCQ